MNCRRLFSGLCAPGMALVCLICGGTLRAEGAQPPVSAAAAQQSANEAAPAQPEPQATAPAKAATDGRTAMPEPDPAVPSLEDMLSVALQHNPDIRSAEAQLQVAEAELDRTRLEVVQKLVAFRDRWQTQQAAVVDAQHQLREAQQIRAMIRAGVGPRDRTDSVEASERKLALQKEKLTELQAEVPFLLGKPLPEGKAAVAASEATERSKLLRDTIRPLLKRLINASNAEYEVGRGPAEQIYKASRRLMDVEHSLATAEAGRIAAIETHRERMKHLRDDAVARSKAGVGQQSAALAAEVYLAEADLALLEERAND